MLTLLIAHAAAAGPSPWRDVPPSSVRLAEPSEEDRIAVGVRLGAFASGLVSTTGGEGGVAVNASVTDGRIVLASSIASAWEVVLQGDFAAPGLTEGRVMWSPGPRVRVQFGYLKVPFSAERLVPDALTDLNDRARIVTTLAPGRSVGGEVGARLADGRAFAQAGVFHGASSLGPAPGRILGALRVGSELPVGPGRLVLAVNGALRGERLSALGGADVRLEIADWLVSAEGLLGRRDGTVRYGHHVTVGYRVLSWLQALARWDRLDEAPRDLAIGSLVAVLPAAEPVQFQIDGAVPPADPGSWRVYGTWTIVF